MQNCFSLFYFINEETRYQKMTYGKDILGTNFGKVMWKLGPNKKKHVTKAVKRLCSKTLGQKKSPFIVGGVTSKKDGGVLVTAAL
jgi:hypothetical protein